MTFWVNGIVSSRDKKPYIQLSNEKGMIAQLSMAEARVIAQDILNMAARTEVDAMLHKFHADMGATQEVCAAVMQSFRDYRAKLDDEQVEHSHRGEPEGGV